MLTRHGGRGVVANEFVTNLGTRFLCAQPGDKRTWSGVRETYSMHKDWSNLHPNRPCVVELLTTTPPRPRPLTHQLPPRFPPASTTTAPSAPDQPGHRSAQPRRRVVHEPQRSETPCRVDMDGARVKQSSLIRHSRRRRQRRSDAEDRSMARGQLGRARVRQGRPPRPLLRAPPRDQPTRAVRCIPSTAGRAC